MHPSDCCTFILQGKVVDGQPTCAYHGWRYNSEGVCTEMPSTVMSQGICVKHMACQESGGMVWVAETADAALRTRPQFPETSPQAFKPVARIQVWNCHPPKQLDSLANMICWQSLEQNQASWTGLLKRD